MESGLDKLSWRAGGVHPCRIVVSEHRPTEPIKKKELGQIYCSNALFPFTWQNKRQDWIALNGYPTMSMRRKIRKMTETEKGDRKETSTRRRMNGVGTLRRLDFLEESLMNTYRRSCTDFVLILRRRKRERGQETAILITDLLHRQETTKREKRKKEALITSSSSFLRLLLLQLLVWSTRPNVLGHF